jgi:hypothetical protein
VAVAALVLNAAAAAAISADAEEGERLPADPAPPPAVPDGRSAARHAVMPRRRAPIRQPRGVPPSARPSGSVNPARPPAHEAARDAAEEPPPPETRSELRDWIKDNATLLSNASLLISLAAVALSLLPDVGIFSPYIKALIFAAALLLLTELHHQWPEDLQLHMLRKHARPQHHSWRMTSFALVLQVATLLFAAWAILTTPIILLPLTALAVVFAFYRWYFRRYGGLLARICGIIALLAVLLLSELLMVVVWAAVTGEQVTLQLWAEDVPGLQVQIED